MLTVIVAIKMRYICSVNSYFDTNSEIYICIFNSYCDNNREVYMQC